MDDTTKTPMDDDTFSALRSQGAAAAAAAVRCLRRLHGGDEEALGQELHALLADATAGEGAEEPIVIGVESFGWLDYVTLREYVGDYVQDREIGLEIARTVLDASPAPHVYNQDDAIRHPEYLQLHTALDERLLAREIERLEDEECE